MNTINSSGLAFGSLTFGEEQDLFDPFNLEKDLKDIIIDECENKYFQPYGFDFLAMNEVSVSQKQPLDRHELVNCHEKEIGYSYIDSLQAEDDFSIESPLCNREVNFRNDCTSGQNIHALDRTTKQSILCIVEEDHDSAYGCEKRQENSFANKSTVYSQQMTTFNKKIASERLESGAKEKQYTFTETAIKEVNQYCNLTGLNKLPESNLLDKCMNQQTTANETHSGMKDVNSNFDLAHDGNVNYFDKNYNLIDESFSDSKQKTKRSSKPKSVSSEDVDLAQRRDVVNKTVLRIMRRYFMQKFRDMYAQKFKCKEAKNKWYFEYIKKFTIELFGIDHEDLALLQAYMASIINPKNMNANDIVDSGLDKEDMFAFHNTLYKYSHTRLVNLLKVKPLSILYAHFYTRPIEELIRSEPSVSKNISLYLTAFKDFMRVFDGAADVVTLTIN